MAWLAVASGADAVGFFCWDERIRDATTGTLKGWYMKEHPEQIEDLKSIVGEMRRLNDVLLARPLAGALTQVQSNPAIHASLRLGEKGKRYLVIASDSRQAETTTVKFSEIGDAETVCLPEKEAAPLLIRAGVAKVQLPALGVAIYDVSVKK